MIKNLLHIISFASVSILLSCGEDASQPHIPTFYVHPELEEYLDRFLEEAAERNLEIDTAGINLELVDESLTALDGSAACGLAHVYGKTFPNVRIDRTCWDLFGPEHKETLMFHELGHALLDRPHFNPNLPVGTPLSMMNSTSSRVYNKFTLFKRKYYIDELFGLNPEVPFWAEAKTQSDTLFYYGVKEGVQPWTVLADFVEGAGATRNVVSDGTGNYAYRVSIPEAAKGSSMRLTITLQKDQLPREGSLLDFQVDFRFEDYKGELPKLSLSAQRISSIESIHSGSTSPEELNNATTEAYETYKLTAIDYFVDAVDFIDVYITIPGGATGTIWLDNFTFIERF